MCFQELELDRKSAWGSGSNAHVESFDRCNRPNWQIPAGPDGPEKFVVEGEQHYWVHPPSFRNEDYGAAGLPSSRRRGVRRGRRGDRSIHRELLAKRIEVVNE
jgi:hypothetical protein